MDMPYENTRSSGNIGIINYSKYASKNSKSKSKNKNKNKKSFIDGDGSTYKGLAYYNNKINQAEKNVNNKKTDKVILESSYNNKKKLPEIMDNFTISEIKYIKSLSKTEYQIYCNLLTNIFANEDDKTPFKFRILQSNNLDDKTKKYIIDKLDKFYSMEENDNEYHKLGDWVSQIQNIPFDKYTLPDTIDDYSKQIIKCKEYLDQAVYGHDEAKTQIIQVFAQYLTNPRGNGKILALQGPMGNGKTTLIKNGLSKALGKPFYFIGLGGASDCSYLNGHSYTYEGARPGIIVQALQKNNVLDGVIYFDELDKVSKTDRGNELSNCLCHITDNSQNNEYQDKYLANIDLDLSCNMFVFSFNDESKIDPILLDRLFVINTKGFNNKEKIKIAKDYLLPKIYEDIGIDKNDIILPNDTIEYIIKNYTKEEGVRTLKKSLEKIVSYFNLIKLLPTNENLDVLIKIKNIKFPIVINNDIVGIILKDKKSSIYVDSLYI